MPKSQYTHKYIGHVAYVASLMRCFNKVGRDFTLDYMYIHMIHSSLTLRTWLLVHDVRRAKCTKTCLVLLYRRIWYEYTIHTHATSTYHPHAPVNAVVVYTRDISQHIASHMIIYIYHRHTAVCISLSCSCRVIHTNHTESHTAVSCTYTYIYDTTSMTPDYSFLSCSHFISFHFISSRRRCCCCCCCLVYSRHRIYVYTLHAVRPCRFSGLVV